MDKVKAAYAFVIAMIGEYPQPAFWTGIALIVLAIVML